MRIENEKRHCRDFIYFIWCNVFVNKLFNPCGCVGAVIWLSLLSKAHWSVMTEWLHLAPTRRIKLTFRRQQKSILIDLDVTLQRNWLTCSLIMSQCVSAQVKTVHCVFLVFFIQANRYIWAFIHDVTCCECIPLTEDVRECIYWLRWGQMIRCLYELPAQSIREFVYLFILLISKIPTECHSKMTNIYWF